MVTNLGFPFYLAKRANWGNWQLKKENFFKEFLRGRPWFQPPVGFNGTNRGGTGGNLEPGEELKVSPGEIGTQREKVGSFRGKNLVFQGKGFKKFPPGKIWDQKFQTWFQTPFVKLFGNFPKGGFLPKTPPFKKGPFFLGTFI